MRALELGMAKDSGGKLVSCAANQVVPAQLKQYLQLPLIQVIPLLELLYSRH